MILRMSQTWFSQASIEFQSMTHGFIPEASVRLADFNG